ncbi:hypothetical protein ACEWY4_004756 [Coilia grayii]|uniref:Transmembrane protein 232 n=1 Tax=Coilia grayii TaxID=363190 RepID=A0ABD1KML5_9TELE
MPIRKILRVHSFALLSQTHQDIQQCTSRTGISEISSARCFHATRNPFEVTEEFVEHFNHTESSQEQERHIEYANQLLRGIKRRAGLNSLGEGKHVELPLAWRELVLLSLCNGQIQNAALDALLVSLGQAPLQADQIPVLFYLAQSVLCSVSSDASSKPNLYVREMKLLKLGYLVFLRLFVFRVSEELRGFESSAAHLQVSLDALSHCESCYHQFPDILFAVHFMLRVGQMICESARQSSDTEQRDAGAVGQGYELTPILWRCLLCWYAAQHGSPQLPQELQQLFLHRDHMLQDSWVDGSLGLWVLGEAAQRSMSCLEALLALHAMQTEERGTTENRGTMPARGGWPWQLEQAYCSVLADVCLQSQSAEIQKAALVGRACPPGHRQCGGLLSLLRTVEAEEGNWRLRYGAVQAVVRVCRGGEAGGGLRDAAWLALQQHLSHEHDQRVHTARTLTEALLGTFDTPVQPESVRSPSSPPPVQAYAPLIPYRLAHFLSALYLPPTPHTLPPPLHTWTHSSPKKPLLREPKPSDGQPLSDRPQWRTPLPATPRVDSGRQIPRSSPKPAHVDFVTRTETDLMKIVEDQWQKELQIKMAAEEETEKEEVFRRQKEEEERFNCIMRRRKERLNKDTKPYELLSLDTTS